MSSTLMAQQNLSRNKRKAPKALHLLAVYFISFFCSWMWLMTLAQHQQPQNRDGSSVPERSRKRQRPVVRPSDFAGLKILAYGDTPYQFGGWDVAPVVVESHKLLFWTTPKVGCTVFKKAFRRMEGYKDWMVENSIIPHSPYSNGLNYLYHYRPSEADHMLTDPTWTRALFVRDPKERLLSAYLDKVASNHSYYVRKICCKIKSMETLLQCDRFRESTQSTADQLRSPAVSFASFLQDVYSNCSDPHWKPQAKRLPDKYWPVINFIGHLEHARQDTERLFRKIGAWEAFGASGWPSGAIFGNNSAKHATFAMNKVTAYYSPELEEMAERIYQADYIHPLLNLSMTKYAVP
ncbi:hypothetical protein ACA910_004870 [Epithemia clementina (nom. ined.)]